MGLAMLLYVVLDGYDLGVGMLLPAASDDEKDTMVASHRPVLGRQRDLAGAGRRACCWSAFPLAHGVILTALYLPVALMLIGLILRGVAFDFRVKAQAGTSRCGTALFWAGSLLAAWRRAACSAATSPASRRRRAAWASRW